MFEFVVCNYSLDIKLFLSHAKWNCVIGQEHRTLTHYSLFYIFRQNLKAIDSTSKQTEELFHSRVGSRQHTKSRTGHDTP